MRRLVRDECGQALILGALATGLVLAAVAVGAVGAAAALGARSALAKAADAAALAAVGYGPAGATLSVSYTQYACLWNAPQRAADCAAAGGRLQETVGGAAFATTSGSGFGPLPGWARSAGCVGTLWSGKVAAAGVYRICTGQRLLAARPVEPGAGEMAATARVWLQANVRAGGVLSWVEVTGLTVGPQGQVTVAAEAGVRPALLVSRVRVSETAWPGAAG